MQGIVLARCWGTYLALDQQITFFDTHFIFLSIETNFTEEPTLPSPLALPENYDAQAQMITHQVRGRIFHSTIPSAQLASELMASGAPTDIAEATAIFRAVLACQEVRDTDPHRGNFRWELEDEVVEDLNAVQFVLFYCIPVLCKASDALPPGFGRGYAPRRRAGPRGNRAHRRGLGLY